MSIHCGNPIAVVRVSLVLLMLVMAAVMSWFVHDLARRGDSVPGLSCSFGSSSSANVESSFGTLGERQEFAYPDTQRAQSSAPSTPCVLSQRTQNTLQGGARSDAFRRLL